MGVHFGSAFRVLKVIAINVMNDMRRLCSLTSCILPLRVTSDDASQQPGETKRIQGETRKAQSVLLLLCVHKSINVSLRRISGNCFSASGIGNPLVTGGRGDGGCVQLSISLTN